MFPRCLPAFPPALNEGLHPGTQLDDPRPGQPLRVGIFTSHFFARCPLFCTPLACIQWSSDRFLRDGSSPVQHKASRPGAGTPFRPTPTGYLGNGGQGGTRTRALRGRNPQRHRQDITQSSRSRDGSRTRPHPSALPLSYLSKCPSFRAVDRLSCCRVYPLYRCDSRLSIARGRFSVDTTPPSPLREN